jgi:hypothetical protein
MKDLLALEIRWKYVVNLCGQDFPLRTNLELVRHLQSLNGRNDIAGVIAPERKLIERYSYKHTISNIQGVNTVVRTSERTSPPPHGYKIHFGNAYNFFSREFVDFVISEQKPRDLLQWMQDIYSPDEYYWSTLQFTPGSPGGRTDPTWASAARVIKWKFFVPLKYPPCDGFYQRSICVYGVGDLNWLFLQTNFFANKFDLKTDHVTIRCLEQLLREKIVQQVQPLTGGKMPEEIFSVLVKERLPSRGAARSK